MGISHRFFFIRSVLFRFRFPCRFDFFTPDAGERQGFTFEGWFAPNGQKIDFTQPVTVDNGSGTASVNVGSLNLAHGGGAAITMPTVPGAAKYAVGIPAASLAIPNGGALTFTTAIGSLTIPSNMLSGIAGVEGKKAEIIIGQGDKSKLPEDIRAAISLAGLMPFVLTYIIEWTGRNFMDYILGLCPDKRNGGKSSRKRNRRQDA